MFEFLDSLGNNEKIEVALILAALVGMEKRNEYGHPLSRLEGVITTSQTEIVNRCVETSLEEAKRMMYEADKRGKIYQSTVNLTEIDLSYRGDRVNLHAALISPLTYRELALSCVLRRMDSRPFLERVEFLR